MMEFESTIREARLSMIRRMRREHVDERSAYEAELRRRGVPEDRRERLLAEFETESDRRIRTYERWFRANLQRPEPVP